MDYIDKERLYKFKTNRRKRPMFSLEEDVSGKIFCHF